MNQKLNILAERKILKTAVKIGIIIDRQTCDFIQLNMPLNYKQFLWMLKRRGIDQITSDKLKEMISNE